MFFEGLCGEISIFCSGQTTDTKTNCLTPLRACARGVIMGGEGRGGGGGGGGGSICHVPYSLYHRELDS